MPDPQALADALRRLRSRDLSEAEVARFLEGRGHAPEAIAGVLDHLRSKRIVDDRRLALALADLARGRRAWGPARLDEELRRRGIPEDAAAAAREGPETEEPRERLRTLLDARFPSASDRGRAWRWLVGRGFDPDLVESALESKFGPSDG